MAKKSAPRKEEELRLRVKPGDTLSISIQVENPKWRELRMKPVISTVKWKNREIAVIHAALIEGEIGNIFEKNPENPICSAWINPFWMTLNFNQPLPVTGVVANLGQEPGKVSVIISGKDVVDKAIFSQEAGKTDRRKVIWVDFGYVFEVKKLEIAVQNMLSGEKGFVHIWGLDLLEPI